MPKIKLKNIPFKTQDRICRGNHCDSHCPLCADDDDKIVNDYTFMIEYITCLRDSRYNPEERYVELSEKDFPTNREWLESLSDEDLAAFYTQGLLIKRYSMYPVNIHQIIGSFTSSQQGIKDWLSQPCIYLMEEER